MSQVRFLDQVSVSSYSSSPTVGTGSFLIDASASRNDIEFTRQDNSTFTITIDTGSGGITDIFPYTGSAIITGSLEVIGFSTLTGSLFIEGSIGTDALAVYSSSGEKRVSVNSEGVLILDEFTYTPTAVEGGIIHSASAFWVGV